MQFNKYQSTPEELGLTDYPDEVQEQFWDFINNVTYKIYLEMKKVELQQM